MHVSGSAKPLALNMKQARHACLQSALLPQSLKSRRSSPALSAEPPLVKTNREPLLPLPSRNVGVKYVVVKTTDDFGPMGRLMSLPRVTLGG